MMRPTWRQVAGIASTVLWMAFSSALILANKRIYVKFPYPCLVTGLGQVFSALGGLVLVKSGSATLRPVPGPTFWARRLLPIIASTSATMYFGNASYLSLSVAFIQILKAFTPALTLALCALAGLEKIRPMLTVSMLLITLGTASAVVIEHGTAAFDMTGFLYFMASSLTEAARVVGAEVLLAGERYNSAEALVYIGGPTALVLLGASYVTEVPDMRVTVGLSEMLIASMLSFMVNLSCFYAIQLTSSLTFKVAGCIKNVAVVCYGVMAHGESVTLFQLLGYAMSVAGFVLYSQYKAKLGAAHRGAQHRQARQKVQ